MTTEFEGGITLAEQKNQNQNQEPDLNQLRKVRREKLAELQSAGKDPFVTTKYDVTHHSKEVKENFGEKIFDAWLLHICNGLTYEELECEYAGLNLHNEFRQIKRHITQKYVNKNPKLKRLLSENNLIS